MTPATVACPSCGAAVTGGARFCANCGSGVGVAAGEQSASRAPAKGAAGAPPEKIDPLLERLRSATIGEYDLYGELGRGGMAAVYLAQDLALDRKVAIKVMLPELTGGAGMAERFKREARTAGALSHPNIIPIHAVKQDADGMVYFVMKFVEGRGLDSVIRELGQLPILMVQTILSQVAGALAHAHRKNIIHRDIKPANVMIDESGWAVVTDFGIAKVDDASNLTTTGVAVGTPYYMSPEQGQGKRVTGAADQYSLGVMAYEMLTGKPPFTGVSVMQVMAGHFFEAPDSMRPVRRDCPPALDATVLRMLAKDPADRFPSLDDVVAAVAAPQLAHDDPIRTQMMTLASIGAKHQPRLSVPVSPAPPSRRFKAPASSPQASPAAAAAALSLTQRMRRRPALTAGGLVALLALSVVGGALVARFRNVPAAPAPTASDTAAKRATTQTQPGISQPPLTQPPAVDSSKQPGTAANPTTPRVVGAGKPPDARTARARRDSIARVATARRDSLARLALAAKSTAPTTPPVAIQPPATVTRIAVAPAASDTGTIVIGTHATGAAYYVDGAARGVLNGLQRLKLKAGPHRLAINTEGCTAWDSTVTVRGGENVVVGYRGPRCP